MFVWLTKKFDWVKYVKFHYRLQLNTSNHYIKQTTYTYYCYKSQCCGKTLFFEMSVLGDAERCRYCLEELQYLIEPKRLDCGHVFCKECVSPQILGDGSFQCPTCRWVSQSNDAYHINVGIATCSQPYVTLSAGLNYNGGIPRKRTSPVACLIRLMGCSKHWYRLIYISESKPNPWFSSPAQRQLCSVLPWCWFI